MVSRNLHRVPATLTVPFLAFYQETNTSKYKVPTACLDTL